MPDNVLGPRKTIGNKTDNVFCDQELISSVRRRTTKL